LRLIGVPLKKFNIKQNDGEDFDLMKIDFLNYQCRLINLKETTSSTHKTTHKKLSGKYCCPASDVKDYCSRVGKC